MLNRLFWLLLCVGAAVIGNAHVPDKNPLYLAAQKMGERGLSAKVDSGSSTKFNPSGGFVFVPTYLKQFEDDKETLEAIKQICEEGIKGFGDSAKELKAENDAAAGYALSLLVVDALIQGREYEGDVIESAVGQVRSYLKDVKATDREKQEFYEWSLCVAFTTIGIAAVMTGEDAEAKLAALAEAQFTALTGAKPEQSAMENGKFIIHSRPASKTPETTAGGMAPGFSYTLPQGWEEIEGWIVGKKEYYGNMIGASFRMLPAIKPTNDLGATMRSLWAQSVPEDFKNKVSGMVFRRYVGDGVPAHFVFGSGKEDGRKWDSVYSLYIVDCGEYWQPIILAQTWWDPSTEFPVGASMTAGLSYGGSADLGEAFFATFRCPRTKDAVLVDRAALVGDYAYGSGSNMQWVNVFTGATSMTFVSYGGTLNLKADGKFDYTFSSASGVAGAANFRGAKGKGTWSLKGDLVTCHWTEYSQGDSYQPKDYVYRVAGVVIFPDGTKTIVLKDKLDVPINAITVQDSADFFSTKKPG